LNQKLILGGIGGEETTYFLNFNDPWVTGDHVSLLGNVYQFNTKNPVYSYHYKEKGINIGTGFYKNKVHKFNFIHNFSFRTSTRTFKKDFQSII